MKAIWLGLVVLSCVAMGPAAAEPNLKVDVFLAILPLLERDSQCLDQAAEVRIGRKDSYDEAFAGALQTCDGSRLLIMDQSYVPEIRAVLAQLIAENRERFRERYEKRYKRF
jgi:hypothetical protein